MKNSILTLLIVVAFISCKKDVNPPSSSSNPPPEDSTLPEEFKSFAGLFDGNGVGAAVNLTEDIVILFNKDGDRYAWFEEDSIQVVRDMTDSQSQFEDCAFTSIGAAVVVNENVLYLFDSAGTHYQPATFEVADADEAWSFPNLFSFNSAVRDLTEWGPDFSCPFDAIGAMWNYSYPGYSCFDASENTTYTWMVNAAGDEVVRYSSPSGGFFQTADELENWTAQNNCNGPDGLIPFSNISAACRLVRPNMIQEIFFSGDGTQFSYHSVSEGEFSEIYDLY